MPLLDDLSFNRRERRGLIVLIAIILILIIVQRLIPVLFPTEFTSDPEVVAAVVKAVREHDSLQAAHELELRESKQINKSENEKKQIVIHLAEFDPNTASDSLLMSVGIPHWLADRIVKYRDKGGSFKVKADLAKIYDFPDSLFQALDPYILLPETIKVEAPKKTQKYEMKEKRTKPQYKKLYININTANQDSLVQLYGIGKGYSSRILKYRDKLGGFVSVGQLNEVYGISDSLFNTISDQVFVSEQDSIRKIDINSATATQLVKHPYITWNMARGIEDYRIEFGNFKSTYDLVTSGLLNDPLYAKIAPYIYVSDSKHE